MKTAMCSVLFRVEKLHNERISIFETKNEIALNISQKNEQNIKGKFVERRLRNIHIRLLNA